MTEQEEAALVLEYWNGNTWIDAACYGPDSYVRDIVANRLTIPLCHLSPFTMLIPSLSSLVGGVTAPVSLPVLLWPRAILLVAPVGIVTVVIATAHDKRRERKLIV